jgi:predicted MFS family arabinose efflux permease
VPVVSNRWFMLLLLFFSRTAMGLQFQTVASVRPFLMDALAIDFTAIGVLIGLYMLPGVIIAFPGGMLGQRFGAKGVVVIGLLLMVLGSIAMGVSSSLVGVAVGRLVAGTGAVLLNVMFTKMIADWFAGREIVSAMAVLVSSWPLGLAVGLMVFGPLAELHGWRVVMYLSALASAAALVVVALGYRDPPDLPKSGPAQLSLNLTAREWLMLAIAGAIWAFFNVAYIVLVSFVPEFFTSRGYSLSGASQIVSLIGWFLIPAIPLAGFLVERFGRPNVFMASAFAIVVLAAGIMPLVDLPLIPFGIIVLVIGVPAGLIMALPAQALRPQSRAGGMGVFFTFYYVGMAILPGGAGLARDISGSPSAPALFAAFMMLLCLLGLASFNAAKRMKTS